MFNDHSYTTKDVQYESHRLKANIKAYRLDESKDMFHIDIVNLYSSASRGSFIRNCTTLFQADIKVVEREVNTIISILEERQAELKKSDSVENKVDTMPAKDRVEALEFLKKPNLLDLIVEDMSMLGYVGENTNKLAGYLAAVSRKLDDPLSILVISRSAAGKSSLQDAVLSLVPPEDFFKYTAMTSKSLFYKGENTLQNKILAIEEAAGSNEASYSIRAIQSSKHLSIATTGRDSETGRLKTEEYKVKGPVSLFLTTTSASIDNEMATRFLQLTIDESREQTQNILEHQRKLETLEGLLIRQKQAIIINRHHNAQRLLSPIHVVNPYAPRLTFGDSWLRLRRDHKKYLSLIKTIAFVRQYQRKVKTIKANGKEIQYIDVLPEDIEKANELAKEIFRQTLDELSPPARKLLNEIQEMKEKTFSRKDIRDRTNWSQFQLKAHLKELLEMEYLICISGGPRKRHIYQLNQSIRSDEAFTLNLSRISGRSGRNWNNPDSGRKEAKKVKLVVGLKKIKGVVKK